MDGKGRANEMKNQAYNPYLPSWEYIPDGEPYVFDGRLYVFGSHDRFNGTRFCMNDYVCWSAPADDLSDWKFEGTIYQKKQDPAAKEDSIMQAPDMAQGPDGRFYLYYTLGLIPYMAVAVSERITGPYEYYGIVSDKEGDPVGLREGDIFQFDPGIFRDEDGRIYLYSGFGPEDTGIFKAACERFRMDGAYVMELEADMRTIKSEPALLIPKIGKAEGTGFEGHEFYEASSMRKINGRYYFIYSSILSHELCYALSDYPDRGFSFGGTLISNGDIGYQGNEEPLNYTGNTHGSLVCASGQWYIFYHRQTNRNSYSRQACAERITLFEDGRFAQSEMTSCGLNGGPLCGRGAYPAYIACNLMAKDGAFAYGLDGTPDAEHHPYFTQTGEDREGGADQYIANMQDGATAVFKYFKLEELAGIQVQASGTCSGVMEVRLAKSAETVCCIPVSLRGILQKDASWFGGAVAKDVKGSSTQALYFTYRGTGAMNFHAFLLG